MTNFKDFPVWLVVTHFLNIKPCQPQLMLMPW